LNTNRIQLETVSKHTIMRMNHKGRHIGNKSPREHKTALRLYIAHMKARRYSPQTLRSKRAAIERHLKWLRKRGKTVRDVTRKDLDAYHFYLRGVPYGARTVFMEMAAIRRFYGFLEDTHYIFANPASGMVLRVPAARMCHVPSEDDVRKLMQSPDVATRCGLRDRTFLETVYSSAGRLGEIASLTVHDIDLDAGHVRLFGKNRTERLAPLGRHATLWLRRYLAERRKMDVCNSGDALWISREGNPLSHQGAEKIVLRHTKRAGIRPFSAHALRRACATHMLRRGAPPILLQALLGHGSLKYLNRYLRVSTEDVRGMHANTRLGN
jgi:site-specific recombinase XerD